MSDKDLEKELWDVLKIPIGVDALMPDGNSQSLKERVRDVLNKLRQAERERVLGIIEKAIELTKESLKVRNK